MTDNSELKSLESFAKFVSLRSIPRFSRFLDPAEQEEARMIAGIYKIKFSAWGGYDEAERKMICFFPADDTAPSENEFPFSCLISEYNQKFNRIAHRDILGSFMSLGLTRACLGDIIINDTSVFLFVTKETSAFVMDSLKEAKKEKLYFHAVSESILIPKQKGTYFRAVASSMRLDAILAASFHISRSKACEAVRTGGVKLNYIECLQPDQMVEAGSMLSLRGMGRIKLVSLDGETKKERLGLTFFRYE